MKRIFRKLHLWLSVPFGLLITIMCFSAAMLVLEPSRDFKVTPGEEVMPMPRLAKIARQALPDSVNITGVTIAKDPEVAYKFSISTDRHSGFYINQYTGEVLGMSERKPFFTFMFKLHRWMGGSRDSFGKQVTGATTIVFTIILLTGIVLWFPKTMKGLKNSLKISGKGRKFWFSLHNAGGMYALIFLLALTLTGLTWSYRWYSNGVNALFGVENVAENRGPAPNGASKRGEGRPERQRGEGQRGEGRPEGQRGEGRPERRGGNPYIAWQTVADKLAEANPKFKFITVSEGKASVAFDRWGNQRAADSYTFDSATGDITSYTSMDDAPKASKLRGWIYSIHTGTWGGPIIKWLTFLIALFGASLPLTGYYLWYHRAFKK